MCGNIRNYHYDPRILNFIPTQTLENLPSYSYIYSYCRLTRKLIFYFSKNFLVEPNVMPRLLHKPTWLGEFCFVWEPFPLGGSRMD